jgi:uncharacterized protein
MLHRHVLVLSALALLAFHGVALAENEAAVVATGEGRAEVAPDIAWLNFGISARRPTVAEARDEVAQAVSRLITLARAAGLADEHIATAALSVQPEYDWDPQTRQRTLLGYSVTRHVTLRLADLGKLGDLTEKALGAGVTEASPAIFDTSRRAELEAEALAAAARDARAKAEVMAAALGVGVGAPLRIEARGPGAAPPQPRMRVAMAEADAYGGAETYQPGLIRLTADVTASFALVSRP